MFENELIASKLLEPEVRHFRRLPDGHADKNYQWLRDMIDKVLQLEKEDKNQAALQASHRAPVGSQVNAAAKGKDGKGTGEKKKGKGKNKGGKGGGKDRSESPSGSSGNSTPRGDRPPSGEVPCKFLFLFGNCSKGNDCSFAHRVPSAAEIAKYGFKKSSSGNKSPVSPGSLPNKDKPCFAQGQGVCKYGAECIFSHDPAGLALAKAAKSKAKAKAKGKPRGKGGPRHVGQRMTGRGGLRSVLHPSCGCGLVRPPSRP